jgi:hypothetical protein
MVADDAEGRKARRRWPSTKHASEHASARRMTTKNGAGYREGAQPHQQAAEHEDTNGYQKSWSRPAIALVALLTVQPFIIGVAIAIAPEPANVSWWPSKQYSWTDVVLVGITFLYLVVTGIYAAISYCQWGVLRATLEETKKSNTLALRAWVLAERIKVVNLTAHPPNPAVRLKIRNFGKLPATNWARSHEFLVNNSLLVDPPPKHGPIRERPGGGVIASNGRYTTALLLDSPDGVLRSQIDAVLNGSAEGIVWLVIRFAYTAALKSEGDSSYCWRFFRGQDGKVHAVEHPIHGFGVF